MNYVRVNDTLDTEMLLSWYFFFFFCTLGTVRINNEMSSASVSEGPDSKQCRVTAATAQPPPLENESPTDDIDLTG